MIEQTLPAEYVDLGTHAMHVAELRRYTSDVHRLLKHLPLACELIGLPQGSPDAWPISERADSSRALNATLREASAMMFAAARILESDPEQREVQPCEFVR